MKEEKEKNLLFTDFGTFLNTNKNEQYEVNKIIIFKEGQEKMIANYFLDNFSIQQFEFYGDTVRKLKKDLTIKSNFVVKSEKQNSWNDETQYTLYINGDLNKYQFNDIQLNGTRLDAVYYINDVKCYQCIGWNQKDSNRAKYKDFEEAYKNIDSYSINNANMEQNIKKLLKAYKNYKKALEVEKTYTASDYKKMQLESGTTKEENLTILKNNGYDIEGLED